MAMETTNVMSEQEGMIYYRQNLTMKTTIVILEQKWLIFFQAKNDNDNSYDNVGTRKTDFFKEKQWQWKQPLYYARIRRKG